MTDRGDLSSGQGRGSQLPHHVPSASCAAQPPAGQTFPGPPRHLDNGIVISHDHDSTSGEPAGSCLAGRPRNGTAWRKRPRDCDRRICVSGPRTPRGTRDGRSGPFVRVVMRCRAGLRRTPGLAAPRPVFIRPEPDSMAAVRRAVPGSAGQVQDGVGVCGRAGELADGLRGGQDHEVDVAAAGLVVNVLHDRQPAVGAGADH